MGFTPYCCGQCWKYQLLGRAGESCPYLQPRAQVTSSPTASQGVNQNVGGESLYISLLPENTNAGISKPPLPGLEHSPQGNNSHRTWLSGGLAATWLGGSTPVTRQWWRGGGDWTAMKKTYPKICKVVLMKATVLAFLPCARDLLLNQQDLGPSTES